MALNMVPVRQLSMIVSTVSGDGVTNSPQEGLVLTVQSTRLVKDGSMELILSESCFHVRSGYVF